MERRKAIQPDYDERPERFRLARELVHRHSRVSDVHEPVAARLVAERLTPVLDVGCGEGELARHLPAGAWVGLDGSAELLAGAPEPHLLGDAYALPFADGTFGSVRSRCSTSSTTCRNRSARSARPIVCCGPAGWSPSPPRAGTTRPSWRTHSNGRR